MAKIKDDAGVIFSRILLITILAYCVGFLVYFGIAIFSFPEKYFLSLFRIKWTFLTGMRDFIHFLIPVHCAAILVAPSFTPPTEISFSSGGATSMQGKAMTQMVIFFLISTAIYTGMYEGIEPVLNRRIHNYRLQTELAKSYLAQGDSYRERGDQVESRQYYKRYLSIDPGNKEVADILNRSNNGTLQKAVREEHLMESNNEDPQSPQKLLRISREYAQNGDLFTAYYFATLSANTAEAQGTIREDARRYSAVLLQQLKSSIAAVEESQTEKTFRAKQRAMDDLSSNDPASMIRAYFDLTELKTNQPEDNEIDILLQESLKRLRAVTFFLPKAKDAAAMPGIQQVFFVNAGESLYPVQIMYFGKLIRTVAGAYVQGVEILEFDIDRNLTFQLSAPYGELLENDSGTRSLILRGIDPEDKNKNIEPHYISGSRLDPSPDVFGVFPTFLDLELLAGNDVTSTGLAALLNMGAIAERYGYRKEPSQIEALVRLTRPFGFFILSLLSAMLGWRMKSEAGRPPIFPLLFIPFFPVAVYFCVTAYQYTQRILLGVILLSSGFTLALITEFTIQGVLIIGAALLFAGYSMPSHET